MRIWSLHPKYLDAKGIVALWRETLLAKNVLEGHTSGYKNHPQLHRFKAAPHPVAAINLYLSAVFYEAESRNYNFNKEKIDWNFTPVQLTVTQGQIHYEAAHLLNKLKIRDEIRYNGLLKIKKPAAHPLFTIIPGAIENWEYVIP